MRMFARRGMADEAFTRESVTDKKFALSPLPVDSGGWPAERCQLEIVQTVKVVNWRQKAGLAEQMELGRCYSIGRRTLWWRCRFGSKKVSRRSSSDSSFCCALWAGGSPSSTSRATPAH